MAGLLERPPEQMPQEPIPEDQAVPQDAETQGQEPDESHPAFAQAMQFAYAALYQNDAMKNLLMALSKSQDKPDTLANSVYELASAATERVQDFPPELLILLVTQLISEASESAEAAGMELEPADIGGALKLMILRFFGEMGVDTSQLQAEMDKVTPDQFNQVASQVMQEAA